MGILHNKSDAEDVVQNAVLSIINNLERISQIPVTKGVTYRKGKYVVPVRKEVVVMRRVISILICPLMCFSLSVTVSAQTVQTSIVQPYYEKACSASSSLSISGTTAICESSVKGNPDVTKTVAVQTLQSRASCGLGVHTTARSGQRRCIRIRPRCPPQKWV